jgi:hypothetical protein
VFNRTITDVKVYKLFLGTDHENVSRSHIQWLTRGADKAHPYEGSTHLQSYRKRLSNGFVQNGSKKYVAIMSLPHSSRYKSFVRFQCLTNNYPINSMEPSLSSEAKSRTVAQEVDSISWIHKVHHLIHKSPPLIPIQGQTNPVHTTPNYFSHIHLILSSYPRLCQYSDLFPFGFPTRNLSTFLLSSIRATCPVHFIPLDIIILI